MNIRWAVLKEPWFWVFLMVAWMLVIAVAIGLDALAEALR